MCPVSIERYWDILHLSTNLASSNVQGLFSPVSVADIFPFHQSGLSGLLINIRAFHLLHLNVSSYSYYWKILEVVTCNKTW